MIWQLEVKLQIGAGDLFLKKQIGWPPIELNCTLNFPKVYFPQGKRENISSSVIPVTIDRCLCRRTQSILEIASLSTLAVSAHRGLYFCLAHCDMPGRRWVESTWLLVFRGHQMSRVLPSIWWYSIHGSLPFAGIIHVLVYPLNYSMKVNDCLLYVEP